MDGELGDVARSGQTDRLPVFGEVVAYGINWPVLIAGAKSSDRVVLFEAEAERIDDRMTALAGLRPGELGYLLAHR